MVGQWEKWPQFHQRVNIIQFSLELVVKSLVKGFFFNQGLCIKILTSFSNDEICSFNLSCSRLACNRSASARSKRWRNELISEFNLAASELAWRSWRSNWILDCKDNEINIFATKKSDNIRNSQILWSVEVSPWVVPSVLALAIRWKLDCMPFEI